MSIYKKLLTIQKAIKGLKKDANGQNYQYVSGSKVLFHVRERMDEQGLLLKTEVLTINNERQNYTVAHGKPNQRIKEEVLTTLIMRFTWVDTETGEKDENLFAANGQNDFDKGFGSAVTYAERYFLLKFFHIATDEDDVDNPLRKDLDPQETPLETAVGNVRLCMTIEDLTTLKASLPTEIVKDKKFTTAAMARYNQLNKQS